MRQPACSAPVVACIAATLTLASPAGAQERWPQRQVTIVVPFAAGGSADLLARILQQHMQPTLGVPFVVENRPGAGGSIGTGYVAKSPSDGYTLLLGTLSANVINSFLYSKLPYDVERDFQPVSLLVHLPNLLVVNNAVAAKTVPELIAYLKANDGKVNYGSSGNGTSSHLSAVMFQLASGTRMTHVPFRSTADELTSMIGGHIELAIDSMTTLWPQAQAGAVRAIAVTSAQRIASAPDLPTIGETLNGFSVSGWQGLFVAAGTPRPIVDKLSGEVKRIFDLPEVATALRKVGGEPSPMTPEAFADFIRSERPKWREVVKASGVRSIDDLDRDDFSSNRTSRTSLLLEHDLFRKPVPTFRDHALLRRLAARALRQPVAEMRQDLLARSRSCWRASCRRACVPNWVLVSEVLKPARSWYSASFSRTVLGLPTITTPALMTSSIDCGLPVTLAARTRFIEAGSV